MARTGRPRGFDRDKAVGQAMHLFWEHGFEGVSLEQLRQSMGGISSASFYAAFGSKEALYRTALEDYRATHGKVVLALHDEGLSPRQRIEQALRRSAEMQTDPAHPTGCMVTLSSTICSVDGESVQALTPSGAVANRAAIRACVDAAIEDGTLRHDTNPAGLTTLFDGFLVGLSLQARDGVSHEDLDAGVTQALAAWDANSGRP